MNLYIKNTKKRKSIEAELVNDKPGGNKKPVRTCVKKSDKFQVGFYEKPGKKYSSNHSRRTCIHDAVLNASLCLGLKLTKEYLYRKVPPNDENPFVEDLFQLDEVQKILKFESDSNMHQSKGGMEFNLIKLKYCGVYLACSTISSKEGYKWHHCFIYDSDYLDKNTSCVGRIIDNDPYSGIKFVEEKDRNNKKSARKYLRDMYGNK